MKRFRQNQSEKANSTDMEGKEKVAKRALRDEKGRLLPGSKMGRPKSPQSIQRKINRDLLAKALGPSIDSIAEDMASLPPLQRLQALSALLPYVQPKLASVELVQLPAINDLLNMDATERARRIAEIKETLQQKKEAAQHRGAVIIEEGKDD